MTQQLVLYDRVDGIGILTLNNPEKRNALSSPMLGALRSRLGEVHGDPSVRVVVLRSVGPLFSSGHDLRELVGGDVESYASVFDASSEIMEAIRSLPQPVIAQVQGLATASETASFALPGVHIGLFCTTPGVAVSRVVKPKKTMEMLLTGTPVTALEALE